MRTYPHRRQVSGAAIGARLRRLAERIDREADSIYSSLGIEFQQRWYGLLSLLDSEGPLSVNDAARALGVTHVAMSQVRSALMGAGLVTAAADLGDARRRTLSLTDRGRALVEMLRPVWAALESAGQALNEEAGDPSAALDRLEQALDRSSLVERVHAARSAES